MYLIWSIEHTAWWKPSSRGYTRHKSEAGRYSLDEAVKIANGANCGCEGLVGPKEAIVPEGDVSQLCAEASVVKSLLGDEFLTKFAEAFNRSLNPMYSIDISPVGDMETIRTIVEERDG